jgi:HD-GYP domain-containing protein (c-di-GMP phosphodiesterase class II)
MDAGAVTTFVDELVVALVNARIYWTTHPRVSDAIGALRRALAQLARDGEPFELRVSGEGLAHAGSPLREASLGAKTLVRSLRERGAGGLAFHVSAQAADFQALLEVLVDERAPAHDLDAHNAALAAEGCRFVRLLAADDSATPESDGVSGGWLSAAARCQQDAASVLQDVMIAASVGRPLPLDAVRNVALAMLEQLRADRGALLANARYEQHDAYTCGHTIRVAALAMLLAEAAGAGIDAIHRIGAAALLHDVGKARLPFEILHAPGWLDADQRRELMQHTVYGAEILLGQEHVDPMLVGVAFGHHLALAGRGYPRTLLDEPISAPTRIVKICDVFEGLTGPRPHKKALSPIAAFRTMIAMRDHFDPALLRRFIAVHGAYPADSRVRLSSGVEARVVRQSGELLAPVVAVEAGGEPRELDLSRPERCGPIRIVEG